MKIFVQIASYRDPKLIDTIEDMLLKASDPSQFTFGICWQYDSTENINKFDNLNNFRIKKFHYSESEGLGWARSITNSLYGNEDLTLQLDSHHIFSDNWDKKMLEDYKEALNYSSKPILTTYLTPFEYNHIENKCELPCLMSQYEFSSDKLLMSRPYYIQNHLNKQKLIRARTLSGHFYLVDGKFIEEVPYDPDIYFGGYTEETSMSVRAYTNGYDFFSPYRQYIWHEYTRNGRPKHWEDHGTESSEGFIKTKKTSGERDIYARNKTRQLFNTEQYNIELGNHGLGKLRTLRDYEIFGGFDFKECRIQDYTMHVEEPPNPLDWEAQFKSKNYDYNLEWDVEFFKKHNFTSPKLLTLGILNSSDKEVYRYDFTLENDIERVFLKNNKFNARFSCLDKPAKLVMYYMDGEVGWSNRYEKIIV
jgi:hypothetical protein